MSALNEPTIATDELRPTRIEVDLDVLAENYGAIAAHVAPARVMPILKANAYGHGLVRSGSSWRSWAPPGWGWPTWRRGSGCASMGCAPPSWCWEGSSARRSRAS